MNFGFIIKKSKKMLYKFAKMKKFISKDTKKTL
jgi:hypothetical protein